MTWSRWSGAIPLVLLVAGCATSAPSPDPTPTLQALEPCAEGAPPAEAPVYAFFTCAGAPLPSDPRPVAREAQAADPEGRLEAAVSGLLAGPTQAERQAGYTSFFSEETALALNSAVIDADGLATVDLGDIRFLSNASTSAGSEVLLGELNATVFQFDEIVAVEYRINGSCRAFWEWLQRACEVVPRP